MIRIAFVAACALAVIGAASTAPAQELPPAKHVSYADLDLTTESGVAKLQHRVQAAVFTVCGGWDGPDVDRNAPLRRCRRRARADAALRVANAVARANQRLQLASANIHAPVR